MNADKKISSLVTLNVVKDEIVKTAKREARNGIEFSRSGSSVHRNDPIVDIGWEGDALKMSVCCSATDICAHQLALILAVDDDILWRRLSEGIVELVPQERQEESIGQAPQDGEFEGTIQSMGKNPSWQSFLVDTQGYMHVKELGYTDDKFTETFFEGVHIRGVFDTTSAAKTKKIISITAVTPPTPLLLPERECNTMRTEIIPPTVYSGDTSREVPINPHELLVRPVASVDDIVLAWTRFEDLKVRLLTRDDISLIPVKQGGKIVGYKPWIDKSGWRKMAAAFGLEDTIIEAKRLTYPNYYVWCYTVRVIDLRSGRTGVGVGACASNERHFAHGEADVIMQAHTRGKNRAISDFVGGGGVSFEEVSDLELTPENTTKFIPATDLDKILRENKLAREL